MSDLTPIVGLLFHRRPAAVSGFVSAFIVDAIKSFAWWRIAHIGEKVFECQPAFANRNASPSPIRKSFMVRIATSLFHCLPAAINRRIFGGEAMLKIEFASKASATGCFSSSQIAGTGDLLFSTVASDKPLRFMVVTYHCPTTKTQTCDISESGHTGLLRRLLCQEAAWRWNAESPRLLAG